VGESAHVADDEAVPRRLVTNAPGEQALVQRVRHHDDVGIQVRKPLAQRLGSNDEAVRGAQPIVDDGAMLFAVHPFRARQVVVEGVQHSAAGAADGTDQFLGFCHGDVPRSPQPIDDDGVDGLPVVVAAKGDVQRVLHGRVRQWPQQPDVGAAVGPQVVAPLVDHVDAPAVHGICLPPWPRSASRMR